MPGAARPSHARLFTPGTRRPRRYWPPCSVLTLGGGRSTGENTPELRRRERSGSARMPMYRLASPARQPDPLSEGPTPVPASPELSVQDELARATVTVRVV